MDFILPPKTNPCDFFLDVITPDQRSDELKEKSLARIDKFVNTWEANRMPISVVKNDEAKAYDESWQSTWIGETSCLLERNLKDASRDVPTFFAAVGQSLIISLLLGFLYWDVSLDAG
jgi:hypothetical protein